jgi:hypothetical protein
VALSLPADAADRNERAPAAIKEVAMATRRRRILLRAGLGLLAVAVLLQLVPYGRDHTNPPVTEDAPDAPWPDGRARELATAACYETRGPTA